MATSAMASVVLMSVLAPLRKRHQPACAFALGDAVRFILLGRHHGIHRAGRQEGQTAASFEHLKVDPSQVSVAALLLGDLFGVKDQRLRAFDPPDRPEAGENAHPVGGYDEKEDGDHKGKEPPGPLAARYALGQIQEELEDDFEKPLEPAWYLCHAPGRQERDQDQHGDGKPGRDHGVGDLEVSGDGPGGYGFGRKLYVGQRRTQESSAELVAEGAPSHSDDKQNPQDHHCGKRLGVA